MFRNFKNLKLYKNMELPEFVEQKKNLILGVLLAVVAMFSLYRMMPDKASKDESKKLVAAESENTPKTNLDIEQAVSTIQSSPMASALPEPKNIFGLNSNQASLGGGSIMPSNMPVLDPSLIPVATPTPTPPPPPPINVGGVSPDNVFSRTGKFNLTVTGEKFTPEVKISVNGNFLPTRFLNDRQLSAEVPETFISSEGLLQVVVKNASGTLYSNPANIKVNPPPSPAVAFIGFVGAKSDSAVLKETQGKEVHTVKRGEVVLGRFRVVALSENSIVLNDEVLNVKHTLPLMVSPNSPARPTSPQPPSMSVDNEL